jgi:hypothetical protein
MDRCPPSFESPDGASTADEARPVRPVAFPGRWIGGAVGAVASLIVGGVLWVFAEFADLQSSASRDVVGAGAVVGFLGIPIAFALGRHFAPIANDGGWRSGLSVAVAFALLAPPLGDLEIVLGSGLAPWAVGDSVSIGTALYGGLLIGIVGLVVSYVALPVTGAVALLWIVLMRTLIGELPARLEMPWPISRLGVRHAVIALIAWLVVTWTGWAIVSR